MFRKRLSTGFLSIVLMVLCLRVQAREPNYRRFTTADGLPTSEVYVMKQDRQGVLWLGTDHGLCSYDGTTFRTYSTRQGLTDNTVFRIEEDAGGRIWVLTYSGSVFYLEEDSIRPFPHNKVLTDRTRKYVPTDLQVDAAGGVRLNVQGSGSFHVSRDGKLTEGTRNGTRSPYRYVIERTGEGVCYPLIFYNGVYESDQRLISYAEARPVELKIEGKFSNRFRLLQPDSTRLFFSVGKELFEQRAGQIEQLFRFNANVLTLMQDRHGSIWVGTEDGVYRFSEKAMSALPDWYLQGDHITCIAEDHEGGYWFSSLVNGVYYTPGYGVNRLSYPDGMLPRPMRMTVDDQGRLVVADWSGAVIRYTGGRPEVLVASEPLSQERPIGWLSAFAGDDRVFISRARPSYIRDSRERFFLTPGLMGTKSNYLRCADGTIYCAGSASLHEVEEDSLVVTCELKYRINCLAEGPPGYLLLGTNQGVFKFNRSTHEQSVFDSSLVGIRVEDLQWMGDQLLVATKGRGVLWRKPDGSQEVIGEAEGLLSDMVHRICVDGYRLWCGTNKGVGRIDFNERKRQVVSVGNILPEFGLISDEVNDLLVLRDTLYAAGPGGISVLACSTSFLNAVPPPISITGMSVNERGISSERRIRLAHDENTIQVRFNAVSFRSGGQLRYRYQLTNGTDTVSGTTTSREVQFLALRPGAYRFSVNAINASGVVSEEPAVAEFHIHPAWWQTIVFRLLLVLVLVGLIYLLYRRRLKLIGARYAMERKQASLQLTAMRAQMNPHFIFNVMNSIRSYMLNKDTASAEKYLTSFSRLVRYTLDHSDEQDVSLEEELKALSSYVELEQQRFTSPFQFRMDLDPAVDVQEFTLPSLLLQPFVENAIKHGIARRGGDGKIVIRLEAAGDGLRILIEDNGVGRRAAEAHRSSSDPAHVSHGTGIAFARIEAFNKAFNRKIRATYSELNPGDGEFPGTRVEIGF